MKKQKSFEMKVGLHKGISFEEYFDTDAVNNSALSLIHQSPAHYKWQKDHPEQDSETPAKLLGKVCHSMILEPETVPDEYAVLPEGKRRPTAAQLSAKKPTEKTIDLIKFWEAFDAQNAGKKMISAEQYNIASEMRDAVYRDRLVRNILTDGEKELTGLFKDWETNIWMKIRIDNLNKGWLGDVKTSDSASIDNFQRSIAKYGNHRQAALYLDGYKSITGEDANGFVIMVVEKTAPYCVVPYVIDEAAIEVGRAEYRDALKKLMHCQESGIWPGYVQDKMVDISLPKWYSK